MAQRVVVFFDWQNVYMRAREAFHDRGDPAWKGQADPVDLAHVLLKDHADRHSESEYELVEIRIYRGRPTQQADPKGYNAFQRQTARWSANKKVRGVYNDLRYPEDWGMETCDTPAREKGIDVALAVDLVTLAHDEAYDVAIVMSADYDLVPAVEHVASRRHLRGSGPVVEVAAWKSDQGGKPLRIRLKNQGLYCIWLDRNQYWGVQDEQDYSMPVVKKPKPAGPTPGGWLR